MTSFEVPAPPARYFYNRFWMHKLRRWGWSYVEAGLIARDIAEKCHLAPHDIHARILRDATDTYRLPDPAKAVAILRNIRTRKRRSSPF